MSFNSESAVILRSSRFKLASTADMYRYVPTDPPNMFKLRGIYYYIDAGLVPGRLVCEGTRAAEPPARNRGPSEGVKDIDYTYEQR
jgi:hypothetical protein